jgi:phosphoribosylpyrophosphate synthetase
MAEPVMGNKSKSEGKTEIFIEPADQARIKGYTAIVSEDILATGGTLNELYIKLLAAGVTSVIVMVTYPIVAANALQYLGNKDGLTIITTDGRTPQHDILQTQNFIQIPVQSNFAQLLQLDRDGVDLWSEEGQRAMAQWGFCLAPWLTHI